MVGWVSAPLSERVAALEPSTCYSPALVFSVRAAGRPPEVLATFDGLGPQQVPFFAVALALLHQATSQAAGHPS